MDWKTLFLTPQGRIGKREFWIGFLVLFGASFILNIIPVLGPVIALLLVWPQICIHSKRLHDAGRSAWLMLIPFAVAMIAMVMAVVVGGAGLLGAAAMGGNDLAASGSVMAGAGMAALLIGLSWLVGLAFLLWVGLSNGDPGPNRFGPPPAAQPTEVAI